MNNKVQKTLDVASHKYSIRSYIGLAVSLLGYVGYDQVGAPAMDKVLIELNDMEDNQEINNHVAKEHTKWIIANILVNNPKVNLDSIYKEADLFLYWRSKH